jgi:hypothetical protein
LRRLALEKEMLDLWNTYGSVARKYCRDKRQPRCLKILEVVEKFTDDTVRLYCEKWLCRKEPEVYERRGTMDSCILEEYEKRKNAHTQRTLNCSANNNVA